MATNKTRTELKQFFVKNAIPTQSNFADLIDAQLNQAEDGVFKQPDQPLGVVAVVGEQRRALQLYSAYPAANPDWLISLNPKKVAPAVGNQAGFGVADGTGTTRLLLDPAGNLAVTGNITAGADLNYMGLLMKLDTKEQPTAIVRVADFKIGHSGRRGSPGRALVDNNQSLVLNYSGDWTKTEIHSPLTVGGAVEVNVPGAVNTAWGRFAVTTTNAWGDGANQYVTLGAGGAAGIMFANPHVVWNAGEARASIRYGRSGGSSNGAYWDVGARASNGFSLAYNGSTDHKLFIDADGDVSISGFTTTRGLAVNDMTNTGVGRGLWVWGAGDSNHVIYSASPGPTGKSPNNSNAVAGYLNASHRMRFRTASNQGFLFENSAETALVDIDSSSGNLWTRGAMYVGGSDMYFTQTDHNHTGIGNTTGYAAIENAANYGALMILGRNMGTPQAANRVVKLWDFLEVNGKLSATGGALANAIGLGTQEHGATSWPYETIQMNPAHNLRIWFGTVQRFMMASTGVFTCTSLTQTSDGELKTAVEPLPSVLDKLLSLRGVGFRWKDDARGSKPEIGLIAQEVEQLFPELVEVGDWGHRGIKYGNFTALLLEAIKEQQRQLDAMQQTLNSLRPAVE